MFAPLSTQISPMIKFISAFIDISVRSSSFFNINKNNSKFMKNETLTKRIFLKIMGISIAQLFLALLCVGVTYATELDAQDLLEKRISLKMEGKSIKNILSRIELEIKVKFVYSPATIKTNRKTSLTIENEPLKNVLETLFSPLQIKYRVVGERIILSIAALTEDKQQEISSKTDENEAHIFKITGKIIDEGGAPLIGASILLKGTTTGTISDVEGKYSISVPDENAQNGILIFSYIGYTLVERAINSQSVIDVRLDTDVRALQDVVVVGYGTVKKSDLTGSVASVGNKDLTAFPVINAVQGLQGRAAGVQIIQNSGEPGAALSVRIRGGNSLRGNNEPLYVVDGFPLSSSPTAINPTDIESMEVLKDASATAIYGSRGANGVVIITTKKGKSDNSQVSLESYYGFQSVSKMLPLLNAREFAEIANERASNDGGRPFFTQEQINAFGEGTNWQKELFRTAPIQNHAFTMSGGNEKTQYSVAGNYFGQDGIIKSSTFWRGSLRASINHKISEKLKLTYNSILSRTFRNQLNSDNSHRGNGVLSGMLVAPPTIAALDANGNYNSVVPYAFSPNVLQNPLAMALEVKNNTLQDYILANAGLIYEPIKGLTFQTSFGLEDVTTKGDFYSTRQLITTPTGAASISYDKRTNILNENIVNYSRKINDNHHFTFTGGFTYQSEVSKFVSAGAQGFTNDMLSNNSLQAGSTPGIPISSVNKWTLLSYLGRANYNYKGKYLFTASIRSDGSSRFGKSNKWGYFPSLAFAWRVIEEDFLKNVDAISDLKLRVSWGKTGSTALAPYQSLNLLNSFQTIFNNDLNIGIAPGTDLANPDLKWETTAQTNIGLDIGLISNRLRLTLDYYQKNTVDLLAIVPLPTTTGYNATTQNIGEIRNRGVELGLEANIVDKAFKWDISANLSINRNIVISFSKKSDVFGQALSNPIAVPINLVREGYPIGVFFGFMEDGLNERGEIKYKDLDGNGTINNNDRGIIGDPNPDFIYGFSSTMSYKNFEMNLFIQGVQGVDLFNFNLSGNANSFSFGENQIKDLYTDRWTSQNPNPNAKYPKVSVNTRFRESDRYVENGSYLRLRNIQVAYNIPVANLGLKWFKKAQVYVSGQNLLTITKYSWFDPEVNTIGGGNSISVGIDQNGYPTAKTFTMGLRLNF
jgi:TonB-dependent starch-binding outer membrane protein SusC